MLPAALPQSLLFYVGFSGFAALLALGQCLFIARQETNGKWYFVSFLFSASLWSVGSAFQISSESLAGQIFWSKIQYLGITTLPILWCLFISRFTDTFAWLQPIRYWLFVVPLATIAVVFSNELHLWFWPSVRLDTSGVFPVAWFGHGFWFSFIHIPYSNFFTLFSIVMLVTAFRQASAQQKAGLVSLTIAIIIPLVALSLFLTNTFALDFTPVSFVLSSLLITWSVARQKLLRRARISPLTILNSLEDAVFVLDDKAEIIDLNMPAKKLLGLTDASGEKVFSYLPTLNEKAFDHIKQNSSSVEQVWAERHYRFSYQALEDAKGYALLSVRDITERKQMQEQLLEGALLYDSLTSLANRTLFMDRLEHALAIQQRSTIGFAVLFIDLDRFKVINDSLGHGVGDQLLLEAALRLQACIRPHDTIARLGGDEFAIILMDMTASEATALAQRTLLSLEKSFLIDTYPVLISASIGITMSDLFSSSEELLKTADIAMYHVKTHGKGGVALYDHDMHAQVRETLDLELELRAALQQGDFSVHYQPILDLNLKHVTGFEALARWNHATRGWVSPAVFIPIAEEIGLVPAIDEWVLNQACQQLASWHKRFPEQSDLSMSVNLSAKNFALADVVERVQEALITSGIAPSHLKLEVTESVLMENPERTAKVLEQLRAMGLCLQIDDFGTGYSSLSYLHKMPLQSLKIDRSFVMHLPAGPKDSAIISSIVALANSLNLGIVAEGIETAEQLELIQSLGCQYAQGFFFARPAHATHIEKTFLEKEASFNWLELDVLAT